MFREDNKHPFIKICVSLGCCNISKVDNLIYLKITCSARDSLSINLIEKGDYSQ